MTDQDVALEATEEVVQPEAEQVEASEETVSTEGQVENQPAEEEGDKPEAEEISPAKARRERRKAEQARLRNEAETAKAERDAAQAQLEKIEAAAASAQPPKADDFDDHDQYLIAVGAHSARQVQAETVKSEITEQTKDADKRLEKLETERRMELAQSWADQKTDAAERYVDFDKVVHDDLPISAVTAELLISSDVGADLAYHLGSNPDLAKQIAQMSPLEAAKEIGRLEVTISVPKPRNKTNAPDPINPVRPKASASDPAKMSPDEYRNWRQAGGTF